ncbi:MAG: hypothetical protein M1835_001513 [Candelina submexicana]|nr:MAG: hypothetical protein M1835_001513 [Candelina submexicana]
MVSSLLNVPLIATLFGFAVSTPVLDARQNCGTNFQKCMPSGAKLGSTPAVGGALSSLYVDLLDSIKGVKKSKRDIQRVVDVLEIEPRDSSKPLCCAEGSQCLLLQEFDIPFCYDKFTTNYFLPDGSFGSVITGDYTSSDNSKANLISGVYTLGNGTSGNVYDGNQGAKPNTATLVEPTPYTAAGVGSAINPQFLGGGATFTTTIPGTTIAPTTMSAHVESATVVSPTTRSNPTTSTIVTSSRTISTTTIVATTINIATTLPETTVSPTTIQGTTIAPVVTVVTISGSAVSSASAAANASPSKGAASLSRPKDSFTIGASFFSFALIALVGR